MRRKPNHSKHLRRIAAVCRVPWAVLLLLAATVFAACTTARVPIVNIPIPVPDIPVPDIRLPFFNKSDEDFSRMGWFEAFEAMHIKLAREYPFTEHKAVNWEAIHAQVAPKIGTAEVKKDSDAFYLAMREYAYAIPDGNMGVYDDDGVRARQIGGGYGLSVIRLDDGRVIAYVLEEDGPAAQAGMQWGAEVLSWNGQPIDVALAAVPVIWAKRPPATEEGRRIERLRFLTRAPEGTNAEIAFRNPDAAEPVSATLTARADGYSALDKTYANREEISEFDSPIQSGVLDGNVGYIKVHFLAPTVNAPFPANAFRAALQDLMHKHVTGLVVDLRGNSGGANELVPRMVGHFFQEAGLYENLAVWNKKHKEIRTEKEGSLQIKPEQPYYGGNIAVLVDDETFNAAEGFAMAFKRVPNAKVVGVYGTHGSFALAGGYADLPGDRAIYYPIGRSLDAQGAIQLESNAAGEGGVVPDIRVPLTPETVRTMWVDGQDLVLQQACQALTAPAS